MSTNFAYYPYCSFYEILMVTANHLQHLVIITATLRFVKAHVTSNELGVISQEHLHALQRNLNAYHMTVKELHKTTKYVSFIFCIFVVVVAAYLHIRTTCYLIMFSLIFFQLASFSPIKNPLYIDYDEYVAERKRLKLRCYFKYTSIVIGISVFICLKVRKLFFGS